MKYVLPCLILINCCSLQGVFEWTVIRKVTDYGQNVTLFCNVSNCCPQASGWDKYSPEQRTLFIDLKTGRPNRKYDGKVTGDGYTLIIQNLTKSDLNVSYACVYGVTIGEIKYLLEEDVFTYIHSTQPNVSTGESKFSEGEIAGFIAGPTATIVVLLLMYKFVPKINRYRNRNRDRGRDRDRDNNDLEEDVRLVEVKNLEEDVRLVEVKNLNEDFFDVKRIRDEIFKQSREIIQELLDEEDRHRYTRLMLSSKTAKRYFVKIMIVGKEFVGKTSLLRKLLMEDITDVKSTDGIDIDIHRSKINIKNGKWIIEKEQLNMRSNQMSDAFHTTSTSNTTTNNYAQCGLWDFAGQKEFYCTHQAFLTRSAIYLVVADIRTDISTVKQGKGEAVVDGISCSDLHEEDYVDFWFDSIHCYRRVEPQQDGEQIAPPVIVVFTGKDRLNEEEKKKRQTYFNNKLTQLLGEQEKYQHYRYKFFVSNTQDGDDSFEPIRNKIYEVAQRTHLWGTPVPSTWILLEQLIDKKRDNETRYLSFDDIIMIAKDPHVAISDKNEVSTFLNFQREVGKIVFFKDIPDLIILEPKWLANAFRCLVSDKLNIDDVKNVSDKEKVQISSDWAHLEKKGEISNLLIDTLFQLKGGDSFLSQKNQLLKVMKKFDILFEIEGKDSYIMPNMFPQSSISTVCKNIGINNDNCHRTSWFCLKFKFLPPSFFNHLLVWLMKNYCATETISNEGFALYRSICAFDFKNSECEKLLMTMSVDTIALQVVSFPKHKPHLRKVCTSVRKDIRRKIVEIKKRYGIELSYKQMFKCSDSSCHTDAKSYDHLIKNDIILCSHHKKEHKSATVYFPWVDERTERSRVKKMKKKHRQILQTCSEHMVNNLYNVDMICEYLEVDYILTEEMRAEIKDQKERSRQARKLLSILPNRGKKAYDSFIDALKRTENKNVAYYLSLGPTDWPDLSNIITTVKERDIKQFSRDSFTKKCRSKQTYSMTGVKRGQFILISNTQFKPHSSNTDNKEVEDKEKIYSDFDQSSMNQLFMLMGYDTDGTQINKTNEEIKEFLKQKLSKIDNDTSSMYDSLVILFLSGKCESSTTVIYDSDGKVVPKKEILDIVKSCKHFKGKPKVVIIQTYSVKEAEVAFGSKDSATKDIIKKNGPNTDDIFVVSSYLRTETGPWMIGENMSGSYFIQALIHVFKNFAFKKSFMELLQEANRCLMQAVVPDMTTDGHNSGVVMKKTVAQIVLLEFCEEKKLYFFPGYTNPSLSGKPVHSPSD